MRSLQYVLILSVVAACGDDGSKVPIDAPPGHADAAADAPTDAPPLMVMASESIGPAGGTVAAPGIVSVAIPSGALGAATTITIGLSMQPAPSGALTPVFTFGPDGLVFAHPVQISMTLPAGTAAADTYWSKPAGMAGFDNIGGRVTNGTLVANVVHFSSGYAGPAMTTRTVTGSQVVSWVSASRTELVPANLTTFAVAALVEDGNGGYTTFPGVGHADGTFTIDNVPDGPYWLRVPGATAATGYYRTNESAIDAGFSKRGRSDQTLEAANTSLVLNVTNLAPWQDGDTLELVSSEANSWHFVLENTATAGVPQVGDTGLSGLTLDMTTDGFGPSNHIDGSHTPADRAFLTQASLRTSTENVPYKSVTRIFEPAPFTVAAGTTTTLSGAFTNVATPLSLNLEIRGSEITAARTEETRACDVPPGTTWTVLVNAGPGGPSAALAGATADFLWLDIPLFSNTTTTASNMSYAIPVTGTWTPYVLTSFGEQCRFQPPGATTRTRVFNGFASSIPIAQANGTPIGVRLGQVRTPTIAGQSLFSPHSIGLTPTVAWTAPSVGTPSWYLVRVIRLSADAMGNAVKQPLAVLRTDQTSMTLPPGILTAGQTYVIAIAAEKDSNGDLSALERPVLPDDLAQVASVMLQP